MAQPWIMLAVILGRSFIKRFALCYRTVVLNVCPVCPVCDAGALWPNVWMVGWITMKLGVLVDLGPGHIVLDGDPTPPPQSGQSPPIFRQFLLPPNCWIDQDATWYGGRSRPMRHCIRWGPSSPLKKGHSPQFSAHVYCGQTAVCIRIPLGAEVGLVLGDIVLDGDLVPPSLKGHSPQFSNVRCRQTAGWYGSRPRPRPYCVRRGPSSPLQRGHSSPISFRPMSIDNLYSLE